MAYARVGAMGTVASGSATVTPSFAQATTAGNLLIGWVSSDGTATITTSSSGWSKARSVGGQGQPSIFYKQNCSAGETAPTFTATSGTLSSALAEFSGGDTVSPVDQTGGNGGLSSPVVGVCAAADVAAGELFVTTLVSVSSKAETVTTSDTYNNGATPTGNLNNDATSIPGHYRFAYGVTTGKAAADQDSAASGSKNLINLAVALSSFKLFTAAAVIPDVGMALTVT